MAFLDARLYGSPWWTAPSIAPIPQHATSYLRTSSAEESNAGGTVRPSALAVLRLTTS
jgi:hypothetical protein